MLLVLLIKISSTENAAKCPPESQNAFQASAHYMLCQKENCLLYMQHHLGKMHQYLGKMKVAGLKVLQVSPPTAVQATLRVDIQVTNTYGYKC